MNRVALIAAAAVALVGVVLFALYMKRFESEVRGGEPVEVLVARADVEIGTALTLDMLASRKLPQKYVESRHIRAGDRSKVVNMRVSVKVHANDSLMWSDLATGSSKRRQLSELIRPGMRAITMKVERSSIFGQLLRPGDRVDVLLSGPKPRSEELVTVTLLQDVMILGVGTDLGVEGDTDSRGTNDVSVLVTPDQASLLAHGVASKGKLSLVLRNPEDIRLLEKLRETNDRDLIEPAKLKARQKTRQDAPERIERIGN